MASPDRKKWNIGPLHDDWVGRLASLANYSQVCIARLGRLRVGCHFETLLVCLDNATQSILYAASILFADEGVAFIDPTTMGLQLASLANYSQIYIVCTSISVTK